MKLNLKFLYLSKSKFRERKYIAKSLKCDIRWLNPSLKKLVAQQRKEFQRMRNSEFILFVYQNTNSIYRERKKITRKEI